ncbi:MAG: carbohydrate-binding family 9-like protein [Acutalibacteraceae bacterium]
MKEEILELEKFNNLKDFFDSQYTELDSFHWEADIPYRPRVLFKMGVVDGSLTARLKRYEREPKTTYTERNQPVYEDSCLEFFFNPFEDKKEYINIECNSSTYLSQFGDGKQGRVYVSDITDIEPRINRFGGRDENGFFWGVAITVTKEFISAVYKTDINTIDFNCVKANFYKCGDKCNTPHFVAFNPVTTLPPGFHNPSCFAIFKIKE